ncbi:MAG: helix-turn-helix domain-containing protein [Thermoplasmataceae archaeon]
MERHIGSCMFVWNHFLDTRNRGSMKHKKA